MLTIGKLAKHQRDDSAAEHIAAGRYHASKSLSAYHCLAG